MKRRHRLFYTVLALLLLAGCAPKQTAAAPVSAAPVLSTREPAPSLTPEPTPSLTSGPSADDPFLPSPSPIPTPEPITIERLDSGEFDSYFDDTLFLGDSITDMLAGYVRKQRETEPDLLGSAQLFGVVSMSVKAACQDIASENGMSFRYRGHAVSVTGFIRECGAKRVFIMLGVNDIGCRTWDSVEGYFTALIDVIHEKCPDTEIVIQGILPVTERYCRNEHVQIERWNSFNPILSRISEEHGTLFLDFSKSMMDENGYLPASLSSDQYYHLSTEGEAIWIRELRLFAARQMYPDAEVLLPEK